MLDLKKEQKSEYIKKVTGMAESIGFKVSFHPLIIARSIVTQAIPRSVSFDPVGTPPLHNSLGHEVY